MHSHAWQLEKDFARLQFGQLVATVDPGQPREGLVEVHLGAHRLAGARLLGIAGPSFPLSEETLPVETRVRGADLAITYPESASRPVRIDAVWRAVGPRPSERFVAAVELVVSVQTNVSHSRPELTVQSSLSASGALRLMDADTARCRPLAPLPGAAVVMHPGDAPGCLLLRLPDAELSYAEMVHPADFRHDRLTGRSGDSPSVSIRHHLFSERLEKGVILRARVRGVFLPRGEDAEIAAKCYTAFALAEPPLGS